MSVLNSAIFDESDALAGEILALIDVHRLQDTPRVSLSDVACSLSLEHWAAVRRLLRLGLLPSAAVVHRAQFEALVRSIWLLHAASDDEVSMLAADLSSEAEHATRNLSTTAEMMRDLARSAPSQAYGALARFKESSWTALNSYVHAGIHPIRRHGEGYPVPLLHSVLKNANGVAVVSCMHAAVLSGQPALQARVLEAALTRTACMPPQ